MKTDAKRLRLYAVTDRAWAGGTEGLLTMEEAEKSRTELERKLRPTLLFA